MIGTVSWSGLKRKRVLWPLLALAAIAALLTGTLAARAHTRASYQTATVTRADLTQSVTASGTVNPQNTINVGTQDSGTVSAIYVDYNSPVRKGEVLARLDTSQFQAQLAQAQATLAQAQAQAGAQADTASGDQANIANVQAGVASAQSNLTKAQAALQVAQQTVTRDRALLSQGYIAQSQADSDGANAVAARSALQAAQAALIQAQAQTNTSADQAGAAGYSASAAQAAVAAAQAQVAQDELMMQRAVITSPVDGTVIARDVSVGQTVAASLQAPTLFEIAQNLHQMQADISVGEPDIGNVRAGDAVSFSVLAYPNQTFTGTVAQVRVDPTTVNNVVTYDVVTRVDNPKNQLLPGMTANASISVDTAKNALVVPAQALTFRPAGARAHAHHTATSASPWGATAANGTSAPATGGTGLVFLNRNGTPTPVRVRVDLISGAQAAVTPLRGTLAAGDAVIVADGSPHASAPMAQSAHGGSHGPGGMGFGRGL